jgi:hypothetical protein
MRRGGPSFILGKQELPLLDAFQVSILSIIEHLKEGGALLGFWQVRVLVLSGMMSWHPLLTSQKGEVESLGGRT